MPDKTILVVGTYDTKNDELDYMVERIHSLGGATLSMDISILGDPERPTDGAQVRWCRHPWRNDGHRRSA